MNTADVEAVKHADFDQLPDEDAGFSAAWKVMEDRGYQYSEGNVDKVHLGWMLAKAAIIPAMEREAEAAIAALRAQTAAPTIKCPTCGRGAQECRFGAPCFECVPPNHAPLPSPDEVEREMDTEIKRIMEMPVDELMQGIMPEDIASVRSTLADAMQKARRAKQMPMQDDVAALVERLKHEVNMGSGTVTPLRIEAAALIQSLQREVDRLFGSIKACANNPNTKCATDALRAELTAAQSVKDEAVREAQALREALEAEDAYWAASRAYAASIARTREDAGSVLAAAERRREIARAFLAKHGASS